MIIPVSQIRNRQQGTVKIGDTLFVNGSPHVECTRCGKPIKLTDSHKITIGRWHRDIKLEPDTYGTLHQVEEVKLILRSVHGCSECWDLQDQEKQQAKRLAAMPNQKLKVVFFPMNECDGRSAGLTPGQLPKVRVK